MLSLPQAKSNKSSIPDVRYNFIKSNYRFKFKVSLLNNLSDDIFNISGFKENALRIFQFQSVANLLYREYVDLLGIDRTSITSLTDIPFLPISFFKSHAVMTDSFTPEAFFESSGTTGTVNSRHYIKDLGIYRRSFLGGFRKFYGDPAEWCIIGLLPSYLERQHSSLVMMVDELVKLSAIEQSGFYLYEHENLVSTLANLESKGQKTLLIGVSFALLDLAERFSVPLKHTVVMETGGMKGRREEMTREQVHEVLKNAFGLGVIHSEYGMTELLSQGYSKGNGIFFPCDTMRILLREEDDPFAVHDCEMKMITGIINVIDLANIYSCSFIATEDAGKLYPDGSFEVTGRVDHSDIRGCSLMVV
jgi:hypothetical protein